MITEKIFDLMFLIPTVLYSLIPNLPHIEINTITSFGGIIEIFAVGNIFFPVSDLMIYLGLWISIGMLSLTKTFIEWVYKLIPLT